MEIRLNTATDSRKDAELMISFLSAYYGITDATAPFLLPVRNGPAKPVPSTMERSIMETKEAPQPPVVPSAAEVFAAPLAPVPPAAVAPPAPTAPAAAGTPPAPTPVVDVSALQEVDSSGLPWDERIHSKSGDGSHPKNADGTWRARRGVQPTYVRQIEGELRAKLGAPTPAAATPQPPAAPPAPVIPTPPAAPAPAAATPQPPAAPPSGAPADFAALMARIAPLASKGVIPLTTLGAVAAAVGLPDAMSIATRPDLVPQAWAAFVQMYPQFA